MELVAVSALRTALGFDDMSNLNAAIGYALSAATVTLADTLRNLPGFDLETVTETFYVRAGSTLDLGRGSIPNYRTRLALGRGFLTGAPVVTYGDTLLEVRSDPTTISSDYITANLVKGEVLLDGPDVRNKYVSVTSTRGFALTEGSSTLYSSAVVPPWLQQIATELAMANLFANNPELTPENVQREPAAMRKNALSMAEARTRYFPSALHPM